MKILEHECRFQRHCLQVAERLGGLLAVVEPLGPRQIVTRAAGGKTGFRDQLSDFAAATNQSAGNAPLECGQAQRRAGRPHQAHRAHLFHRLHHDNGSRRAEQDFQAFEGICHKGLTSHDLLP